jgi:hypothetical protein
VQPRTPDYQALEGRFWIDTPHDLHDCMHPLTPTSLPLREFRRLYAEQMVEGTALTPAPIERRPLLPPDILRAFVGSRRYAHGYQKVYQDYPRELWG